MGVRITVDTGGTFTDVVVADDSGCFHALRQGPHRPPASSPASAGGPRGRLRITQSRTARSVLSKRTCASTPPPVPRTRSWRWTARTALLTTEGFRRSGTA
ncbi:hypothetical protein HBB16_00075 [Pseudonocardia sp. MCCB 268]|nr:hypothetical protein [Pseudonocardia cytotoxica]